MAKKGFLAIFIFAVFAISQPLFAAKKIGKIVFYRGKPGGLLIHSGSAKEIKLNKTSKNEIFEASKIITQAGMVVKVILDDKSLIVIGPKSEMVINKTPNTGTNALSLVKGAIRAKVNKDYLKEGGEPKNKLYIVTKTAAMGVRGTDFEASYNEENGNSMALTFEGEVRMAAHDEEKSEKNEKEQEPDQSSNTLKNKKGMLVDKVKTSAAQRRRPSGLPSFAARMFRNEARLRNMINNARPLVAGMFSQALRGQKFASIPVKISPAQFARRKSNENLNIAGKGKGKTGGRGVGASRKPKSLVPPGMSTKEFSSSAAVAFGDAFGPEVLADPSGKPIEFAPPEGMRTDAGEYAPPAGGFIDEKTGMYVAPPPGSEFDPDTGVFVPPADFGGIDPETGAYVPPAGFELDASGQFIPDTEVVAPGAEPLPPPPILTNPDDFGNPDFADAPPPPMDDLRNPGSEPGGVFPGDTGGGDFPDDPDNPDDPFGDDPYDDPCAGGACDPPPPPEPCHTCDQQANAARVQFNVTVGD